MPAITESRIAYRPKIGSTVRPRMTRPTNVEDPDHEAEDQLATDPLAEDPLDGPEQDPRVELPRRWQRPIERLDEHDAVLEQVEHPDGQDHVAEERADEAAGARDERQQERQVQARARLAALEPGDQRIDPFADRRRDLEVGVVVRQVLDALVELLGQVREVGGEPQDLVDQRRQRDGHEHDEGGERGDVDDQDRERAADPGARQAVDRPVEEVDEQQSDDERADAVAGHPEQQAEDGGGHEQHRDPRGERDEPRRRSVDGGLKEGWRWEGDRGVAGRGPRQRPRRGRCGTGGVVHRAADYQTWTPVPSPHPRRSSSRVSDGGSRSRALRMRPGWRVAS